MIEKLHTCGLIQASPNDLQVQRLKHGRGFKYLEKGKLITCVKKKRYLKALAIPPVYEDVHMTTNKRFHLQATGLDTNKNRQYFYHSKWENFRDEVKYARLKIIGRELPKIRQRINRDLKLGTDTPGFVLASIVKLLDYTGLRIGNWQSARQHQTYGLITLHKKHFKTDSLEFTGKAGVEIERPIFHQPVQEILETFYHLHNGLEDPLFTIGQTMVTPAMVNDYLDDISSIHMTAKEFRTWRSCALFVQYWQQSFKKQESLTLKHIIEQVADHTCNTVSILKSSYIHPTLLETFKEQPEIIMQPYKKVSGLRQPEALMLQLLKA